MLLLFSSSIFISLLMSVYVPSVPLSLGILMLTTALMATLLMASMLKIWFSLMVFLIYIGGMLVMFAYFSSLTPSLSLKFFPIYSSFGLLVMVIGILCGFYSFLNTNNIVLEFSNLSTTTPYILLFLKNDMLLLTFLALVLFFVLVAVVKITILTMGPLRPFFYV